MNPKDAHQKFQQLKTHPNFPQIAQQAIAQTIENRAAQQLEIRYDPQSDTLTISNGLATAAAADLSEEIQTEYAPNGQPAGIIIDNAAQLLKPHLLKAMLQLETTPQEPPK